MANLHFIKGNWITDEEKVNNFIIRLEKSLDEEAMEFNDDAKNLLAFVKDKRAYSPKQLSMLEAIELTIERYNSSDGYYYYDDMGGEEDLPF